MNREELIRGLRSITNIDIVLPLIMQIAKDVNGINLSVFLIKVEKILTETKEDIEKVLSKDKGKSI